jgi:HD domain-containing protein
MPERGGDSEVLGERFRSALVLASELHHGQMRKGSKGIPYVGHLLGVASIVIEDGGDEDEAIAALLHDAPEDQGGEATLARIWAEYGERVGAIVDGVHRHAREPQAAVAGAKGALPRPPRGGAGGGAARLAGGQGAQRRAILADYREVGEELWSRFRGSREESLWYYRALAEVFLRRRPGPLADELRRTVDEIEALVGD